MDNHQEAESDAFNVNQIYHLIRDYTLSLKTVPGRPDYVKIKGQALEISLSALGQLCHEAVEHTADILQIIEDKKIAYQDQSNKIELADIRQASIDTIS